MHIVYRHAMISDTRTLQLAVLLCVGLLAVLESSHGAPNQLRRDSGECLTNGTAVPATNSTPETDPSARKHTTIVSSETACLKVFKNITVAPPRKDCMPGIMESVPTCSGACNSYVHFVNGVPYKQSECSCCRATSYHITRRTVTFQCGSGTESAKFNIAAVNECNCSPCGNNNRQ